MRSVAVVDVLPDLFHFVDVRGFQMVVVELFVSFEEL